MINADDASALAELADFGLTDDQADEAITEATGLWDHPYSNDTMRMFDFCTDFNAMHDALKTLPPDQLWDVAYSLPMETMLGFMATARELAEAFLRVIGKWQATDKDSSVDQSGDSTKTVNEMAK